jgi:branched-subunit amino acid transport protein
MPDPWLVFLGMAAVTYFTRYAGIAAAGRALPAGVQRWLSYVPIAVLAALVTPEALAAGSGGEAALSASTLALAAGLAAAWRTRNVFWTIAAGMAVYWVLRLVGVA